MNKETFFRWLPWLIIAFGFILRLDQYLFNRSLWLDEAFFVVNVVERTFLGLFDAPLEYSSHIMPPGVLVMAKLSITLFGNSDLVLRLFPFICGTVSLVLFYYLAKAYISAAAVPIALFFFAISEALIFYSSEFKQYSSDVMIVIALFLLANYIRTHSLTFERMLLLAVAGMVAVWFSHTSVFILATIGIYIALPYLLNKQWKSLIDLVAIYWLWVFNFVLLFFLIVQVDAPTNQWMHQFWTLENAFMPSPFSLEAIHWLHHNFFSILEEPGGLKNIKLAGFVIVVGGIVLFAEKKGILFLLTLPVLIALSASSFEQYAFSERLVLFLMPALYLLLAEGIVRLQIKSSSHRASIYTLASTVILMGLLAVYPTAKAIWHFVNPRVIEEIKPVLEHIQNNRQSQDSVYIYYWTEPAFRYYAKDYGFEYNNCHIITPIPHNTYLKEVEYSRTKRGLTPVPVKNTQCILGISEYFPPSQPDLEKLQGQGRVWFVFSHLGEADKNLFLNYLDTIGQQVEENIQPGASVYLYQL
ncbi:conserved hypothetical protein, membrane [Beggiatoa sp. PS]|nr:conserved hypothetical protein, membrane [Beggiatoa sp. PS]